MNIEKWNLKLRKQDAGILYWQDTMTDENGSRISREFLQNIFQNLCLQSFEHWLWEKDYFPLTYKERHWYSHFSSAVNSITRIHLSEHLISRKFRGADENTGRADLWTHHKGRHFFFELKHVTFGFRQKELPKKVSHAAKSVFTQASSLKKEVKGDWAGNSTLVGMCVVLPYSFNVSAENSNYDESAKAKDKFLKDIAIKMAGKKTPSTPTICAAWVPPAKAQHFSFDTKKDGTDVKKKEYIPFVGFVANVLHVPEK